MQAHVPALSLPSRFWVGALTPRVGSDVYDDPFPPGLVTGTKRKCVRVRCWARCWPAVRTRQVLTEIGIVILHEAAEGT